MEILFISHTYPPSVGGMEKQSYELITGCTQFCKVHTLVFNGSSSKIAFLLSIKTRVKKILLENPGISLIHVNDGLMAAFSYSIKKITSVPIVATIHGLDIVFPAGWFQHFIVPRYKKLDGIIAVSNATAQECLNRGFDPLKVFVVRNGVDASLSTITKVDGYREILSKKIGISLDDKRILVSVGRVVKRKGFSWFLHKVLPSLDKSVVYLHIGPFQKNIKLLQMLLKFLPAKISHHIILFFSLGMDESEMRIAVSNPTIRNRAFMLGKVSFGEMVQVLKCSDLFIMPNIKVDGDAEGFGLVALEAAMCDLPVVASGIEGITCAVLDGKNGYLLPLGDEGMWIDKISKLLNDKDLKKFGLSAKEFTLKNYSWKKMVEGYIDVFRDLSGNRTESQRAP